MISEYFFHYGFSIVKHSQRLVAVNRTTIDAFKNFSCDSGNMIDTENNKLKCIVWMMPRCFRTPKSGKPQEWTEKKKRGEAKDKKAEPDESKKGRVMQEHLSLISRKEKVSSFEKAHWTKKNI